MDTSVGDEEIIVKDNVTAEVIQFPVAAKFEDKNIKDWQGPIDALEDLIKDIKLGHVNPSFMFISMCEVVSENTGRFPFYVYGTDDRLQMAGLLERHKLQLLMPPQEDYEDDENERA